MNEILYAIQNLRTQLLKHLGPECKILNIDLDYKTFDCFLYEFHKSDKQYFSFRPSDINNFNLEGIKISAKKETE